MSETERHDRNKDMIKNWRGRRLLACEAATTLHRIIDELQADDGKHPRDEAPSIPSEALRREMQNTVANLLRTILLHNDGQVSPQTLLRF